MPFFICVVPVCPVRAEASHRSEHTTQLLFGEKCELLESVKDFVRISVLFDKYEGWCQASQLEELEGDYKNFENTIMAGEWVNEVNIRNTKMFIPFGSCLPTLQNGHGTLGKDKVMYNGNFFDPSENALNAETIKRLAYVFVNTPYLWGGKSVFGIDCSGFTQMVFKSMNIRLQRDSYQQATQGDLIGFLQEVKCGDLAFFDNEAGKIIHVGILLDDRTIIHSSGKVRIDTIDNLGIVNSDTGRRTHNLRIIKRITG